MIKVFLKKIVLTILTLESRIVLWKYKPKIVGVTGNAGKTSTKEAIAAVLGSSFSVWKNEKSYNSDIGIPLTILHCPNAWSNLYLWIKNIIGGLVLIMLPHNYPEWLVVEVGADRPGDIKKFTSWLKPDVVVVTRIGETPVHVENFPNRNALIKEKAELVKALKHRGCLVLNADDPDVLSMRELVMGVKVITFGFSPEANLRASNYHITYEDKAGVLLPSGINFKIDYLGNVIPVRVNGIIGRNNIYSSLAAFAVGTSLSINFVAMTEAISAYERPVGRLKLIEGINNSAVLDDTYNSSPSAVMLALESLSDIENAKRKIVVLGDMLELGKHTMDAHLDIGKQASVFCDLLITVGQRSKFIAEGAKLSGMASDKITSFNSSKEAGKYLREIVGKGDIILVKGSQGVRMERTVEEIIAHPEDKKNLIPRQDPEWLSR